MMKTFLFFGWLIIVTFYHLLCISIIIQHFVHLKMSRQIAFWTQKNITLCMKWRSCIFQLEQKTTLSCWSNLWLRTSSDISPSIVVVSPREISPAFVQKYQLRKGVKNHYSRHVEKICFNISNIQIYLFSKIFFTSFLSISLKASKPTNLEKVN